MIGEMPDLDKVIEGLECCSQEVCPHPKTKCPYYDRHFPGSCQIKLHCDAVVWLRRMKKEREE